MRAEYKAGGTLKRSEWAACGSIMAERAIYPVHFSTPKIDADRRKYVEYTEVQNGQGPSRYGEFPGEVPLSGRCVGAEDPITHEPYDPARPGLVLQPERGPGHCFQDEPGKTDEIRYIWDEKNPVSNQKLSEESKTYLKSRIAPPYPWEPFRFRMRLYFQDGSSVEIPCDENARVSSRDEFTMYDAVRIEIPLGVTAIEEELFNDCDNLVDITLPEGVTTIGEGTFSKCSSLAEIALPTTLTRIKYSAFEKCTSLAFITLPAGVTRIQDFVFYGCTSLAEITLPEGVTTIGRGVFIDCTSLASVTLPRGVTTIGGYAFYGCTSLASVTLPEGVTTIGEFAFNECTSLGSITLPRGVTTIGGYAFYGCTSLAEITLPAGVTTIEEGAFSGCTSLKSIILPSSVETYGEDILGGCTSLRRVYLANDLGQQQVDVADLGVNPSAVTIYRNFRLRNAYLHDALRVRDDSDEGPPDSRARTEGALYDWTGGEP